ncbi:hypothetical protein F4774DRAFT_427365 [Daldinia eschscholtzii]|nr:hypothetical protein F4774DRAFT_427365 [Daldinia eschscholtzii]
MSEYMTTQQVREALAEREALVDEFRQKQDDVNRIGLSLNRAECEKAVKESLEVERRLDEDLKKRPELATQTHELANVRDEVTALRCQVDEKDKLIQESNASRDEANRRADSLTDELATKTIEASILANKLEDAERRLSQLDESVPRLKEQIRVSEDNIVVLNENVTSRDERISALNEEITKLETRVVSLEVSLQQVSPELEDSRHTKNLLREQSTIATKAPEAPEARELGIARFFAIQSGWEGAQYSRWLPYIRVVAEADSTIGSNPTPTPLPWVVLETWRSDKEQQLGNYPYSDVVSIACKLYGYALQKETDEEPLYLLGLLARRLAEDKSTFVAPIVHVLEEYLEITEDFGVSTAAARLQMFYLGLGQVASLIAKRWPSFPGIENIRLRLRGRLTGSPFSTLDNLLDDANLEAVLREQSPKVYLFYEDLKTVFVSLRGLGNIRDSRDWIFALNFTDRVIRMVHRTRGKWTSIENFTITAPAPEDDLVIRVRTQDEFLWIQNHF